MVSSALVALVVMGSAEAALAQESRPESHDQRSARGAWTFMQDGVLFVMFNDQGSPRGERELRAPNWWMGMAQRRVWGGTLTIDAMLSLDPATVGAEGYSHIFQIGETFRGNALIDHQHPHDFVMQLAAVWRRALAGDAALTLAGGPVGEPALGPVAYMHRSSAAENPMSPLGHHTLDSTHIAMGVITAGVDRGPFQIESSIFRGAEPDENRWDVMDPGALDSWSVRGWYRPSPEWSFQISHGYLTRPDALEDGDVRRTTASASWIRRRAPGSTSLTLAWGRNKKLGGKYDAFLGEATRTYRWSSIFWRVESTQVETNVLRTGVHRFQGGRKNADGVIPGRRDFVGAVTGGLTRTIWQPRSWDLAIGAALTGYAVPAALSPFYGRQPWSGQIFLRVRPPAMHRMTDTIMTRHAMPGMD
jgi:hypothetical protein